MQVTRYPALESPFSMSFSRIANEVYALSAGVPIDRFLLLGCRSRTWNQQHGIIL